MKPYSHLLFSSIFLLTKPVLAQQWMADSTEIKLGVNLSQGSLDAGLPLPSLPTTDDFAPQASLSWLSTAMDPGEGFGPGWGLGLSSIVTTLDHGGMIHASADRLGKTTGDFKYSLEWDGQRLVWLDSVSATRISHYTVEHSESKVVIVRHDRPFTVKLYTGTSHEREVTLPAGFRVIEPNGVVRVYSGDLNVAEGIVTNAEAKNEFSRTFISRWPLVYEIKPSGNTIEYQYQKIGNASVLKKIIFAYERSAYVFHWQEREHGPISRTMGYMQERRHLYTRIVACYDEQPQQTWVFDYQNGPAASFEESSCAESASSILRSEAAEPSLWSRLTNKVEDWFQSFSATTSPVMVSTQPRLVQLHRFGSKVGDLESLKNERHPTLSFRYTAAEGGLVHVKNLAQDGSFQGFGPSGNLEFLDADQDGFVDLMKSSADGSQMIAGRAGTLDLADRKTFLVKQLSRSLSLGFNEDSFRQGTVMEADMNGDGWADIVHIKPDGSWLVYVNDRRGSYQSNGAIAQLDNGQGSLTNLQLVPAIIGYGRGALMDMDGDQRADIIYPSLSTDGSLEWQVYLNKGGFVFQSRKFAFPFRSIDSDILKRNDLRFVDANHDGLVDLIKFSQGVDGNSSICIFENMGRTASGDAYLFAGDALADEKGCASQVAQVLPDSGKLSNRINNVWLADISGDGLLDVVDLNDDGRTFSYWLGQVGHTAYGTRQELVLAESQTLAIDPQNKYNSFPMDLNLDGTDEIIFFEPSTSTLKVLQFPGVRSGTESGLLAHINEEKGLDHWIQYQPTYSFGFKTGASLPYPSFMVRQLVSRDSTLGSESYRAAVMNYQEPLWDGTRGMMLGFKRAQVFEPGTRLAEGRAVEDARIEDYLFAFDSQNEANTEALSGRWAEKSLINIPWTETLETRFAGEVAKADNGQTLTVDWKALPQSRLWREKQGWSVREFPENAANEGTAHVLPRREIILDSYQTERCDSSSLDCSQPQIEQTVYQYDEALRVTKSLFTRSAYQTPQDTQAPGALPLQYLTKTWSYESTAADSTHSILQIKSYQEYDDAKATRLVFQEDFEYLGKNTFDLPDASTQTLYRRLDQTTPADLPESIHTRRILNYDAFGNSTSVQDESGGDIASSLYDSGSGSLLLESHEAGNPSVLFCYSQKDCSIQTLPDGISLPLQGADLSLRMDSAGAWESRQMDALHRPIKSQTSTGLRQSQTYQLDRKSVTETVNDKGTRLSTETMLADGRLEIRLSAQTGPEAGQLWINTWTQTSRQGSTLLASAPFLVNTADSQEVMLGKNRDLIPKSTQFTSYDALGRITHRSLDSDLDSVSIRYFPWGQEQTTRNDQNQNVTQTIVTRLDASPTLIIDATGSRQLFAKNVWGEVESVRLADDTKARRFLSYGGRLPAETFIPGLRRVSYTYDDRLLIKDRTTRDADDQVNSSLRYSYDDQRRLLQIRNAQNQLVTGYTYANDFLASATQNDPAQTLQVRRVFTRDEQGRVRKEQILYQNRQRQIVHQAEENYEYTEDSLLERRTTGAGAVIRYQYAPDQSTRSVHFNDQEIFQARAYDASGLLHEGLYAGGNLLGRWDHDPITRLTARSFICRASAAECTRTIDEQFHFTNDGQLLTRTRVYPEGEEKETFGYSDRRELLNFERNGVLESFTYTGSGHRKNPSSHVYDKLGRLQKSSTIDAIVYSERDRPLSVTKGSQTWWLGYDAQGDLVYRMSATDTEGLNAMFLDFGDVVQQGSEVQQILQLPGTMQAAIDSKQATIDFQWLDAQGSPIATLDESGTILERNSYKAFGQRQQLAPTGSFLPLDFAGQRLDTDTGLVAFRDRWYDPEVGLFISPDARAMEIPSLCLEAQWMDCNLYGYQGNNPL